MTGTRLTSEPSRGRCLDECRARLVLSWHPVALRGEVWAENELAVETARLETAVCLGYLVERDPLGDARPNGPSCQQPEEPLQVLPEPRRMSRPHDVYRVDAEALAASATIAAGSRCAVMEAPL